MRLPFLLAGSLLTIGWAGAQDEPKGKLIAPKDAGFELRFPSEPKLQKLDGGDNTIHVAGVTRKTVEGLAFTCHWIIRDKGFENKTAEAAYLQGQVQGSVQGSKGKLVEDKEIALNDFPGRQFIIEVDKQNMLLSHLYLAGRRVIRVTVMGKDREAVTSAEALRFFNSLKISK